MAGSDFLKSLDRDSNVRIRHFEQVLDKGLLGKPVKDEYTTACERGPGEQIREFYGLASLERVRTRSA